MAMQRSVEPSYAGSNPVSHPEGTSLFSFLAIEYRGVDWKGTSPASYAVNASSNLVSAITGRQLSRECEERCFQFHESERKQFITLNSRS